MAVKQELHDTERSRVVKVFKNADDKKNEGKKGKGIVSVAPHVRMVNGRPVYVAGYIYRKK